MKKRFTRIVLLQIFAIFSLCSCMENPQTASVISQVSELPEEKEYVAEEIEPAPNPFFFTMESESKEVAVSCELNFISQFTGTATLRIEKLQGMKLDHFYEVKLTNLEGECSFHNDTTHPECEFSSEFPIGIFCVDSENIYLIPYEQAYIEFLREADTFPLSEEELANYYQQLREKGEHSGYINWRLVCTENGFEDTIGKIQDENDLGVDGILRLENYHNYITVDGDGRHYHLYPELTQGTQERMYMTWKEGQGIVSFKNYSGSFKDYISFQAEMNRDGSIDEREITC